MPWAGIWRGSSLKLAVGKPRPVPRLAPPVTVPFTRHQCPSRSAAAATSPAVSRSRMRLDEMMAPSRRLRGDRRHRETETCGQPRRERRRCRHGPCRTGSRGQRRCGAPPASRPARRLRTACAESPENAASNGITTAKSSPSSAKIRSFSRCGVMRNIGWSGRKNSRGCGSNIITPAGAAWRCASALTSARMRLWPR